MEDDNKPGKIHPSKVGVMTVYWPMIKSQTDLAKAAEKSLQGDKIYSLQGKKVGEILHSLGIIENTSLRAVEYHANRKKENPKPIGELLVHMGKISTEDLKMALCIQSGVPMVDLSAIKIPIEVLECIPKEETIKKKAIPVGKFNNILFLAVHNPLTFTEKNHFSFLTGLKIKPVYAPYRQIEHFIDVTFHGATTYSWDGNIH